MIQRAEFYIAGSPDGLYVVERYVRGQRETEGSFATRAFAQARADELNSKPPTDGEQTKPKAK